MTKDAVALTAQVKEQARLLGARIVGVGTPDRWVNAPRGHKPQDFIPEARAVVSFGMPLFRAMSRWPDFMKGSEMFPEEREEGKPVRALAAMQMYGRMQYDAVNLCLTSLAYRLGCLLNDLGYQVVTPPATGGSGWANSMVKEMTGIFFHQWSQRHAAVAAGLGELGLNNMFICPEYGIRVRLGSVITDAPLVADPLDKIGEVCTQCEACTGACADPDVFGQRRTYELVPGHSLTCCTFQKDRCRAGECAQCLSACPVGK